MSTSTSTSFVSSPWNCSHIQKSLSAANTSRKLITFRDSTEKHSDLTSSVRGRLVAIRSIMEYTLRIFRCHETANEYQQVCQTYITLLDISRARYSASLKLAATKLIQEIIKSMGQRSNADGDAHQTYSALTALLSNFRISNEKKSDLPIHALLPPPMKTPNTGASSDNLMGGEVDMLILGATGSGKTTLVKRMHATVRQKSITEFEYYRERLISDMIALMKMIIKEKAGEDIASPSDDSRFVSLADAELSILTLPTNLLHSLIQPGVLVPFKLEDVSQALCMLWGETTVRRALHRLEAQGNVVPNASYFFDSVSRIFASDYTPSNEDISNYQPEKGLTIHTSTLNYGPSIYNMIEVPWEEARLCHGDYLLRYGPPEVILFVVALSDYNQVASDSDTTNTLLDESLACFASIVNSRWLVDMIIVLVLTKHERFEKELTYLPLKHWMLEYQGETSEAAWRYIAKKYTDHVKDQRRLILTHCPSTSGLLNSIQSKLLDIRNGRPNKPDTKI